MHPSFPMRIRFVTHDQSVTPYVNRSQAIRIHGFDGIRTACGLRLRTRSFDFSGQEALPSDTEVTCQRCLTRGEQPARYDSPALQHQAAGLLTQYALDHRDPHVLARALQLLGVRSQLEPLVDLISRPASYLSLESRHLAVGLLTQSALDQREPRTLAWVLQLLGARPQLESLADLISSAATVE